MRIGFFGGGRQALAGLNALHEHWNIAFVRPRFMDDPVLSGFCHPNVVPVLDVDDVNAPVAIGHVRDFAPDLIVSINERSILKRELRSIARFGAINLHNGLLPRQGGGGGAYAAIVNGEPCGMTIHFMDDGIDTGDIILQHEIPVSSTMTMGAVQECFIKATPDMIVSAVQQVESGTVKPIKQSGKAFHYTPAKPEWDELIDWTEPAKRIFDKVRARTPGPANFYLYDDKMHFVQTAELEPLLLPNPVQPGQVIKRDSRGVLVKTGDTGIWITKIRVENEFDEKIPQHRVGTMLRYNMVKEIYELRKRLR